MLKHNKKRNIGLLSEFFAKYIANAAVEFRYNDMDKAKEIWRNHVMSNKLLRQEFALFETLHKTHIKDNHIAHKLLEQVKQTVERLDQVQLDEAKTKLIHEINTVLKDENFFNRSVEDFRTIATIQVLLNTWGNKKHGANISQISKLEDQILEHVTTAKKPLPPLDPAILNHSKEDINKLVINVFKEKIESKYNDLLNEEQKNIIGLYVFSKNQLLARQELTKNLTGIKENTLKNIDRELKNISANQVKEKLTETRNCLLDNRFDTSNPNEETITLYLAVCSLNKELESAK
jgi:hypothetical protein